MKEDQDHIEHFFKKHLEVEQSSFVEDDWAQMAAKLDQAGLGTSGGSGNAGVSIRKGLMVLLLVSSLAFILGWLWRDYNGQIPQPNDGKLTEVSSTDQEGENQLQIKEQKVKKSAAGVTSGENIPTKENATPTPGPQNSTLVAIRSQEVETSSNAARVEGYSQASHLASKSTLPDTDGLTQLESEKENKKNVSSVGTIAKERNNGVQSLSIRPHQLINSGQQSIDPEPTSYRLVTNSGSEVNYASFTATQNDETNPPSIIDKLHDNQVPLTKHPITPLPHKTLPTVNQRLDKKPIIANHPPHLEERSKEPFFTWTNLAIGLAWAPDFTSLNFKGKVQPTNKLGLRLFWKPLQRLEVQSGVFFNEKKYTSPGEEYHPPAGYWAAQTNGIVPEWVNGSCTVVDIPVTVGFDFIQKKRWNWSINGGVSNYILLDEKYIYEFERPNPNATRSWETDENTSLKWSVANWSIAGEFLWRPRTVLRVEPFIQIPLQEIGWANVALYGYGALFTIKHNLLKSIHNNLKKEN